jgi:hypothetical protein
VKDIFGWGPPKAARRGVGGATRRTGRVALVLLLPAALAAGGCESSQEKSARIEKQVKAARAAGGGPAVEHGLTIDKANPNVRVVATEVLRGAEATAVVVTLRNLSGATLRNVPIAITVKDAAGRTLYRNDAPGLERALTTVAAIRPGEEVNWVDDQVQANGAGGAPATVEALLGEAPKAPGEAPTIKVSAVHPTEEAGESGAAGTVVNDSPTAQQALVVYATARRNGRITAAGRAVIAEVPAHGTSPFQVLFIGSAKGAQLEVSAPPSTF